MRTSKRGVSKTCGICGRCNVEEVGDIKLEEKFGLSSNIAGLEHNEGSYVYQCRRQFVREQTKRSWCLI